jgi:hypothetical protein
VDPAVCREDVRYLGALTRDSGHREQVDVVEKPNAGRPDGRVGGDIRVGFGCADTLGEIGGRTAGRRHERVIEHDLAAADHRLLHECQIVGERQIDRRLTAQRLERRPDRTIADETGIADVAGRRHLGIRPLVPEPMRMATAGLDRELPRAAQVRRPGMALPPGKKVQCDGGAIGMREAGVDDNRRHPCGGERFLDPERREWIDERCGVADQEKLRAGVHLG